MEGGKKNNEEIQNTNFEENKKKLHKIQWHNKQKFQQ